MKAPDFPPDEPARLDALRALNLLDTAEEERFDRLTRIARDLFGVDIVLVSLVDANRQWFKSCQGTEASETGRDVSFCGHAILADQTLEITDTYTDPRFHDNPLVKGEPHIRFYAGAPLHTETGHRVGTLCLIHSRPHQLSASQHSSLRDLADAVEAELNRQSEQALLQHVRRSEQRLQSIIEGTNVGTWEWNVQTGQTVFNERWADIVGYTLDELEPINIDTWLTLAHPDDLKQSEDALNDHFEGRSDFYDVKCRMKHKSGQWVWVHDRGRVVSRDDQGNPLWVAGTHSDVTRDMHNQKSLQRQLDAFEVLNSIAADHALSHTQRMHRALSLGAEFLGLSLGIVSQINGQEYRVRHSVSPEGLDELKDQQFETGRTYCDLTLASDDVVGIAHMAESRYAGHPCYTDFGLESYIGVRIALDGDLFGTLNFSSSEPRATPFTEGEKQFVRLLGRWVSGTIERHNTLSQLRLSESRLRALFELSPIGIALNDFETGQFIDVNDALLKSTGYERDEFLQLDYYKVTPAEYFLREREMRDRLESEGRYGPFEKEYFTKSGTRFPVVLNGVLARDHRGRRLIWSIIEDISERKRVDRMKDEFISTVSHELRTPLTAITGSLRLLSAGMAGELPDEARSLVDIAFNNGQRLGYLINDLLDMEKLVSGKLTLQTKPQPLLPLVEAAIRDNQAYADQYNVSLRLSEPVDNPVIQADGDRIQQVLANLLSNAAKFSPPGAEVLIGIQATDTGARVTVTDQGPGIPASFLPRLFGKFSQVDASDRRSRQGTGLGLAISKALIEQMNGSIGVDTEEGRGACFHFTLPTADTAHQETTDA